MRWNGRSLRPRISRALLLSGSLSLALGFIPSPLAAQEIDLDLLLDQPMDREVEEAVDVLRRYLAVKAAERALAAEVAGDAFGAELTAEVLGAADPRQVTAAAAPGIADASLTISHQLHLADSSALFKDGEIFLWDDTFGGNLALGRNALAIVNGSATGNTAVGTAALEKSQESNNTAVGHHALQENTTGDDNTATGSGALAANTTGSHNTATGSGALAASNGPSNTAHGNRALNLNLAGAHNTAMGNIALRDNSGGNFNTAVGGNALLNNVNGWSNVAIGFEAGVDAPANASDNIFIAHRAIGDENNPTIRIGTDGLQTRAFVSGIYSAILTGEQSHPVCVDDLGQLGECPETISSLRFKQDVTPLGSLTESLLALEPVSFRYRDGVLDGPGTVHFGLIAEQVADVFPEMVVRDADGAPFGVRYDLLSVFLLGELRHQHEIDARQEESLERLERRLAELEERGPSG